MLRDNKVSVIIPVYNAADFVQEAVDSVITQKDDGVGEIILIEDCSPDNSLQVCREIVARHKDIVRLIRHPGGENKGAGASRNLGIENAICGLICFLDADDYWLPNRLKSAVKILRDQPEIDGVYDDFRYGFEAQDDEGQFFAEDKNPVSKKHSPAADELFTEYMLGRVGLWHTNGIVVRKQSFKRTGTFDEKLRLAQDVHLWIRMASVLRLVRSENVEPVAVVRRHGRNRFNPRNEFLQPEKTRMRRLYFWNSLAEWMSLNLQNKQHLALFFKQYAYNLGRLHELDTAWKFASRNQQPGFFFRAVRGMIPGPRRMWRFFKLAVLRG